MLTPEITRAFHSPYDTEHFRKMNIDLLKWSTSNSPSQAQLNKCEHNAKYTKKFIIIRCQQLSILLAIILNKCLNHTYKVIKAHTEH